MRLTIRLSKLNIFNGGNLMGDPQLARPSIYSNGCFESETADLILIMNGSCVPIAVILVASKRVLIDG